jgi:protein-S-isoprenylcysteine O-methyltransferase Ste14
MTPFVAKMIVIAGAICWFVIRLPHQRRSWKTRTVKSERSARELFLLYGCSFMGLGIIPFVYVATGWPKFAERPFIPAIAWLGVAVFAFSLYLFYRVHRELGRNWSDSLEVREKHALVTHGLYARVRHPMYSAFFLWALAQALLLPNWIAGFAGLVGFGLLFFFRVGHEERMMLDAFGNEYREYMARTARIIPGIY